jgi:hypothetical protein
MRFLPLLVLLLTCCAPPPPARFPRSSSSPSPVERIAVIGDFGNRSNIERWAGRDMALNGVETILTVGDNVYPYPQGLSDYDTHVGEFFGRWIRDRKFFPAIGNHDWDGPGESETFVRYFGVPRYYDFSVGQVHFYVLDSDDREPDGIEWRSKQADWFRQRIAENPGDCFRFVVFHHPAVSTKIDQTSFCGGCEPVPEMDWPFESFGIDGVFSGHAHWAERFFRRRINFWTVGATTDDLDTIDFEVDERSKFFVSRSGYLVIEPSLNRLDIGFRFVGDESLSDVITLKKQCE